MRSGAAAILHGALVPSLRAAGLQAARALAGSFGTDQVGLWGVIQEHIQPRSIRDAGAGSCARRQEGLGADGRFWIAAAPKWGLSG